MTERDESCTRCYVSGRVQGVFFRASTRQRASELGLTGYARNLPDGRVEVVACGGAAEIDKLQAWLRAGPPEAEVTALDCEPAADEGYTRFETR